MRDADQRSKQVVRIQIFAQIATPLGALHQLTDRTLDHGACAFVEPGRTSGNGIKRRRNDVLCRDVIDQQQHPGSKRFERRHLLSEAACGRREFPHFVPVNTFDQLIPRREMAIQSTYSDARLLRDSSRLAVAPCRVKASFATSRMRSRLRSASVRGFRAVVERFLVIFKIIATGGCLRLSIHSEATSVLVEAASFRQSSSN